MAKKILWRCDGCDDVETRDASDHPSNWALVTITIDGIHSCNGAGTNGERKFDLCARCQRTLFERAVPTEWARVASAKDRP